MSQTRTCGNFSLFNRTWQQKTNLTHTENNQWVVKSNNFGKRCEKIRESMRHFPKSKAINCELVRKVVTVNVYDAATGQTENL